MREQAESGTRVLAAMIREGRGPMGDAGTEPRLLRIGERLLAELEAAGPPESLTDRVLATAPRAVGRAAGLPRRGRVRVGRRRGGQGRETRFAVWLPGENLVTRASTTWRCGSPKAGFVMVPFDAVAALSGSHGAWLDECQLLVRAMGADEWKPVLARARPLAKSPRK